MELAGEIYTAPEGDGVAQIEIREPRPGVVIVKIKNFCDSEIVYRDCYSVSREQAKERAQKILDIPVLEIPDTNNNELEFSETVADFEWGDLYDTDDIAIDCETLRVVKILQPLCVDSMEDAEIVVSGYDDWTWHEGASTKGFAEYVSRCDALTLGIALREYIVETGGDLSEYDFA